MDTDFPVRLAGQELELDIRAGLNGFDLDEMSRAFRGDKLIPRSLARDFMKMSPENSEPEYTLSGRYQPEVTYGA